MLFERLKVLRPWKKSEIKNPSHANIQKILGGREYIESFLWKDMIM